MARLARIWPLHVATFAIICIIISPPSRIGTEDGPLAALLNLALLQAWVPDYKYFFSFNAVSWSISVEVFFYLIFPMVLLRPVTALILSVVVVVLMMVLATSIGAGIYTPGDSSPSVTSLMYINPATRSLEFVLGVVTALIWMRSSDAGGELAPAAIQCLALAFSAISWIWAPAIAASAAQYPATMEWLGSGGVTALSSAFLIFAFANQKGLARIFALGPLVYLGKISFALYLVHQIPIHAHNLGIKPFDAIAWPVYLVGVLAVSAALHHIVEEPARRWVMRGMKERSRPI